MPEGHTPCGDPWEDDFSDACQVLNGLLQRIAAGHRAALEKQRMQLQDLRRRTDAQEAELTRLNQRLTDFKAPCVETEA